LNGINYIELIRELGTLGVLIFVLFRLEKHMRELKEAVVILYEKIEDLTVN
jgi:hypothetical protein